MGRATLILRDDRERAKASSWIAKAPIGTVIDFKWAIRSTPQNARLHAMLTTLAGEMLWHGQRLSVDDWKLVFMDALRREMRIVPNIDGDGFVNLGTRTSKLSVDEFTELMDLIEAFAAQRGVHLGEV